MQEHRPKLNLQDEVSDLRLRLSDRNLTEIARRVGISRQTIYDFIKNPAMSFSMETFKKLHDYIHQ